GVPFAATHADREWDGAVTRYGPTATPTLMFEKNRPDIKEFIDNLDPVLLDTVISKKAIRNIMIKNIAYSLPGGGRHLFWKYEARKIVPSIPYSDLKPAPEFGGVRTVGINKRTRELKLGEFTLPEVPKDGVNICANMAPSPGASGSLGIAYKNVAKITKALAWNSTTKSLRRFSGSCQWSKDQCTKIWCRLAQVFDSSSCLMKLWTVARE